MKFSEILTYFTDTIFQRDKHEWHNPVVRWLVQQYKLLFYTARGLKEHGTLIRSAALTYDPRRLKRELRGCGVEVLKRDFPLAVEELMRRLGVHAGADRRLAFTKIGNDFWVIRLK